MLLRFSVHVALCLLTFQVSAAEFLTSAKDGGTHSSTPHSSTALFSLAKTISEIRPLLIFSREAGEIHILVPALGKIPSFKLRSPKGEVLPDGSITGQDFENFCRAREKPGPYFLGGIPQCSANVAPEFKIWLKRKKEGDYRQGLFAYALDPKGEEGDFLGYACLAPGLTTTTDPTFANSLAIGTIIMPPYRALGFGTFWAHVFLTHFLPALLDFNDSRVFGGTFPAFILATADVRNTGTNRILQRAGFQRQGAAYEKVFKDDTTGTETIIKRYLYAKPIKDLGKQSPRSPALLAKL